MAVRPKTHPTRISQTHSQPVLQPQSNHIFNNAGDMNNLVSKRLCSTWLLASHLPLVYPVLTFAGPLFENASNCCRQSFFVGKLSDWERETRGRCAGKPRGISAGFSLIFVLFFLRSHARFDLDHSGK
eukprot:g17019.t1